MIKIGNRITNTFEGEDEYVFHIKTIGIYNHDMELVKEILVEQVSTSLTQGKGHGARDDKEDQNRSILDEPHNISTMQYGNSIYYFKRLFEGNQHYLQLFKYDILLNQEEPLP